MTVNMLIFPTSSSEGEAWLKTFIKSQDALDATQASTVYASQASFRFADYPVIQGAKKIEEMVSARFTKLDTIRHELRYFDLVGTRLWAAFNVTYRVKGDQKKEDLLVPCICVFTLVAEGEERGKINAMEIYMDQTAVRERMDEVARI